MRCLAWRNRGFRGWDLSRRVIATATGPWSSSASQSRSSSTSSNSSACSALIRYRYLTFPSPSNSPHPLPDSLCIPPTQKLTAPPKAEQKLSDLRTLLINFHHTLNEYRPHQARESTIALMQDHLDRTRAETAAIREAVERTRRVIEGLGSIEVPPVAEAKEAEEEGGEGREVQVWRAADELLA